MSKQNGLWWLYTNNYDKQCELYGMGCLMSGNPFEWHTPDNDDSRNEHQSDWYYILRCKLHESFEVNWNWYIAKYRHYEISRAGPLFCQHQRKSDIRGATWASQISTEHNDWYICERRGMKGQVLSIIYAVKGVS